MSDAVRISVKAPETKKENRTSKLQKLEFFNSLNSPVEQICFLQRTIGNQAVQKLMKSGALQAKLRIGAPGDVYEQEADRVAERVMRMAEPQAVSSGTPSIQRACPKCEEVELKRQPIKEEKEEEKLQRQPVEEEEEEFQAASGGISEVNPDIESNIQYLKGTGRTLSPSERVFFEPRFGADFGNVRVHNDTRAAYLAKSVNARAFTLGHDVVFGEGEYKPDIGEGKRLLAHELTHVLQQNFIEPSNSGFMQRACQHFPAHSSPDTYCETRGEAEALITRACPPFRNCFVYRDGPPGFQWRRIPGYGCAHYAAHRLGIQEGPSYANCIEGFSVTIEQITQGRNAHPLADARVNDIWSNGVHSGVVIEIGRDANNQVRRARVDQCNTAGNAVPNWVTNGMFYR